MKEIRISLSVLLQTEVEDDASIDEIEETVIAAIADVIKPSDVNDCEWADVENPQRCSGSISL